MNNNDFQNDIIIPALEVLKNSKIKKFFYLPGLLSIVFLSVTLVYQVIYTYVVLLEKQDKALDIVLGFFHSKYAPVLIGIGVVFFILYLLLNPIFEAGLIHLIHSLKKEKKLSTSESFGIGITKFGPLFEYNNIIGMFKLVTILNAFLFMLRFLGIDYARSLGIFFAIIFFLSIGFNTFFAYTKFIIVLEHKGVFESVSKSVSMTLHNLKLTIKLYVLMIFLNLRVIINFLLFFLIPIVFAAILGYVSTKVYMNVLIALFSIISIAIVLILGYISTVFEVLTNAIWYEAYLEARKVEKGHLENEETLNK